MTTGPEYDGTRDVPIDQKTYDVSPAQEYYKQDFKLLTNRQLMARLRMPSLVTRLVDPETQDVSLDDLNQNSDGLRTRESKSFPWFGGMKIVHYYVMKDKE